jgi:ATP-dependent helicase/nuclease subunit B
MPNRRSANALRTVFLEEIESGSRILPSIEAIGDLDEKAIVLSGVDSDSLLEYLKSQKTSLEIGYRLLLLRETMLNYSHSSIEQAMGLSKELDVFLRDIENYEIDFSKLDNLVGEDLAIHWQQILDFLKNFGTRWQDLLNKHNIASTYGNRVSSVRFYEKILKKVGLKNPLLMVGNFEPSESTLNLMKTLLKCDNAYLIFKGLENVMTAEECQSIDETHSHFLSEKTLEKLALDKRSMVNLRYPEYKTIGNDSLQSLYISMLPPELTYRWQNNDKICELKHIQYIECREIHDELNLIMVYLLDHIAKNGLKNIALVANQELSQRLELLLSYWNIPFNNNYGKKFILHGVVRYLMLIVEVYNENYRANKLLSLLKNNFTRFGYDREKLLKNIQLFEEYILHNGVNRNGMESYRVNLRSVENEQTREDLTEFFDRIESYFAILDGKNLPLEKLVQNHLQLAEKLAGSVENDGADILWHSEESGEKVRELFYGELLLQSKYFGNSNIADYEYILNFLISERSYSDDYSLYPAVNITSVQEAQLINYDLVIIANLNDGANPMNTPPDPWMSRKMRIDLGLPPRETEIGKSYFNLIQLVAQKKVLLTRSRNVDGTPSIKSRFLQRLETMLHCNGLGLATNEAIVRGFQKYHSFEYNLENNIYKVRPQPKPPVNLRPRNLSATNIDLLNLNPYDIYVKKILALKKTNPLEKENIHARVGIILHSIFERYSRDYEKYRRSGSGALALLVKDTLDHSFANDQLLTELYYDRVLETTRYFIELDERSRKENYSITLEDWNECDLGAGKNFFLSARIDRMEKLNNSMRIIDYKTGTAPSKTDIICGWRLQLPVEALILSKSRPGIDIESLQYWLVKQKNCKVTEINDGEKMRGTNNIILIRELVKKTEEFVMKLVDLFDNEFTGYTATNRNSHYSDFNHLSRLEEWLYGERPL